MFSRAVKVPVEMGGTTKKCGYPAIFHRTKGIT
ncbi:hypothetical protein BLAT2472_110112 [Burkholderia latens]